MSNNEIFFPDRQNMDTMVLQKLLELNRSFSLYDFGGPIHSKIEPWDHWESAYKYLESRLLFILSKRINNKIFTITQNIMTKKKSFMLSYNINMKSKKDKITFPLYSWFIYLKTAKWANMLSALRGANKSLRNIKYYLKFSMLSPVATSPNTLGSLIHDLATMEVVAREVESFSKEDKNE